MLYIIGVNLKSYEFVTIWRVAVPIETVWNEIYHSEDWPSWWKGVERVVEIQKGDDSGVGSVRRYTWKSKLPYRLTFDMKTVRVEPPTLLEGIASGELDGRGLWRFTTEGNKTVARYDWQVHTTKAWMNVLAPIARSAFNWNHDVIMGWGAEGLSKRLRVAVIDTSHDLPLVS